MRRMLAQRLAQMSDAVATSFPTECTISEPQGGFVLWIRLPEQVDGLTVHEKSIASGIALMPGTLFSPSGKLRNYIRLNCGNAWTPEIEGAVRKLGQIVHHFAERPAPDPSVNKGLRLVG
jgi:DNA-binding transcriptional MocR family regulator